MIDFKTLYIETYNKLIEMNPTHSVVMSLARVYQDLGEWDLAIDNFELSRDLGMEWRGIWYYLGSLYGQKRMYQKAREVYQDYINNVRDDVDMHIYITGTYTVEGKYDEALEEALCFGWIDGKLKSVDDEKYVIRYSPRKNKSLWSKINKDKAESLIAQGRMTDAGLAKIEAARKNGLWDRAYTSRRGDEMPPDLEAALQKDKQAWANFSNFANSYRNNYIFWVNAAKRPETRKKRISMVVEWSRLNKKPGMQ